MRLIAYLIVAVLSFLPSRLWAGDQPFFLKSGDTVVFYGDSITAQDLYTQWIELYTVTRFPSMRVHFFGAGVGGDKISGGVGGPVDLRLSRDVYSHHPTVITMMLGMNDGGYHPPKSDTEDAYVKGYEHILKSFHDNAPGAQVSVLGPSPFDDITRPPAFPGGYNGVMRHYADLDQNLAREHGDYFVNLNPPVLALLENAQLTDPAFARFILPDRVHPEPIAHWAMAEAILKAWNAPSQVSSVSIDASTAHLDQSLNASVEQLGVDGATLRWSETEAALPLPFDSNNAFQQRILRLTDVQKQLNQEMLRITGLSSGNFNLAIDGESVGVFSAEELSNGINLADCHTPMRDQAQVVSWLISDRIKSIEVHMTMSIRQADTRPLKKKSDILEMFEDSLENVIYDTAAPKPHSFSLRPVTDASNSRPSPE